MLFLHTTMIHTYTSVHLISLIVSGSRCCLLFSHRRKSATPFVRPPSHHVVTIFLWVHLLQTGYQRLERKNHVIHMCFLFCFVHLFRAAPASCGDSQAKSLIRAVAAGLRHSHRNSGSEPNCSLPHSSWQCWILNPWSEARDRTCVLMDASQVRFCCATTGTPARIILF